MLEGLARDADGNDAYLKWLDRTLEIGDEIQIKIVQTSLRSKPISEEREIAIVVEEQERIFYEKLKQKYEN